MASIPKISKEDYLKMVSSGSGPINWQDVFSNALNPPPDSVGSGVNFGGSKRRSSGVGSSKSLDVGVNASPGRATVVSAAEALGSPDLWAALATQGINYGKGGVGAFENQDNIRQAVAPNTALPAFGQGRMIGGTSRSAGYGIRGGVPTVKPKQLHEFEQRAKDSRQADYNRSQRRMDLSLDLEFERRKRDALIKQIMALFRRSGGQTETSTRTSNTQQIANVAGLPVRMPITSSESSSTTRPVSMEAILSLLR